MTKDEYYESVKEKLQTQIWDIEMNEAFNFKEIELLERDINDGQGLIMVPGKQELQGKKLIGEMKAELHSRHRKKEAYETKKEELQEQIDFIEDFLKTASVT
jgi:hypothetical protein